MNQENSSAEQALAMMQKLLSLAGLEAQIAERPDKDNEDALVLAITGEDAHFLVGPRGHYLDALQYLLLPMLHTSRDQRPRIILDADGFRAKRQATLIKFAHQLADQVIATGQEAVTDPLNPMERRIVHTALIDHSDVTTYSEGMEPERYVVVTERPQTR